MVRPEDKTISVSIPIDNALLEWCEQNRVDIAALVQHEMGKAFAAKMLEFEDELLRGETR